MYLPKLQGELILKLVTLFLIYIIFLLQIILLIKVIYTYIHGCVNVHVLDKKKRKKFLSIIQF